MTWTIIGLVILILVLLCISGFFSGSETALTAASRAQLHQAEEEGNAGAARASELIKKPETLLGAILLGNNLVNIMATSIATFLFSVWFGEGGVAIVLATVCMTIMVLIFSEVLPKTYAIGRPSAMAMRVAMPISWVVWAFGGIIATIQILVNALLSLFGVRTPDDDRSSEDVIRSIVNFHHSAGGMDTKGRHRLVGALDLKDLTIEDIMVHRKSIVMMDIKTPPHELVMQALSSPHTRIPLYKEDQDNIIGVIHAKDLLRAVVPNRRDLNALNLETIMRKPVFVPETTSVEDQLDSFLASRSHFALVVDEYGALQGLITLEDILEEIVGDIRDEHDVEVQGVRSLDGGSYQVEGWVTIRDLNRATGWALPDDEAVTLAGLVIHEAQTIPNVGQKFQFYGRLFEIKRRSKNQITALVVSEIQDNLEA